MASKLTLVVDSYDQPLEDEPQGTRPLRTRTYGRGDQIEPRNADERARLLEIGAAVDPQKLREQELESLNQRRAQLEAEAARIESELEATKPAKDLSGKDLDAALAERGLSTEGTAGEKRARLSAHQLGQPAETPPPATPATPGA